MDWSDTPEQTEFREYVRRFFEEKLPERYRNAPHADYHTVRAVNGESIVLNSASWTGDRLSEDPEIYQAAEDWGAALSAEGYVAPAWPKELGGAGFSTREQFIFHEEREAAGAPRAGGTGAMFLGSVLMVHGNQEQRDRYMPAIARGEVEWAQGYSEPGAGSDLASLSLRADRDGDEYVLNGQKIWSTPQTSDAIYCLVRTDPDAPKHRGISFLMVDSLTAPGIVMKPLLNACWDHGRFGETFFDDVRVPADNLIGEENRGWYVAMTLMDFDRASISGTGEDRRTIHKLIDYSHSEEGRTRNRIADLPSRARRGCRPHDRDGSRAQPFVPPRLDAVLRADSELRGLDGQGVLHRVAPARRPHRREGAGALHEPLAGRLAGAPPGRVLRPLRADDPGLDCRGHLGNPAQRDRHARSRPAPQLAALCKSTSSARCSAPGSCGTTTHTSTR